MNEWISRLVSLTLSGSMIFAAAVVVRYVFGRKFPKWFLCCLWLPVLFAFLFPLGSRYSLISGLKGERETAVVAEGYRVFVQEETAPPTEQYSLESVSQTGANADDPYDFLLPLWLCGTMIMTAWKLVGYHRFCRRMLSDVRFPEEWEESMLRRLSGNERVPQLLHSTKAQGPV